MIPVCGEAPTLSVIKDYVQFGILAIGLWFGGAQLWQHTKNRRLQSLLTVLFQLQDKDISRARWFAYKHQKDIDGILNEECSDEFERLEKLDRFVRVASEKTLDLEDYRRCLQTVNMVAFLIRTGYVHESIIPQYLGTSFQRTYHHFSGWIEYRRTRGRLLFKGLAPDPMKPKRESLYCDHLKRLTDDLEAGGRIKIDRFAGIKEILATWDQFASARVGRDALARLAAVEADVRELQDAAGLPRR